MWVSRPRRERAVSGPKGGRLLVLLDEALVEGAAGGQVDGLAEENLVALLVPGSVQTALQHVGFAPGAALVRLQSQLPRCDLFLRVERHLHLQRRARKHYNGSVEHSRN